jgi:hypothetical protein
MLHLLLCVVAMGTLTLACGKSGKSSGGNSATSNAAVALPKCFAQRANLIVAPPWAAFAVVEKKDGACASEDMLDAIERCANDAVSSKPQGLPSVIECLRHAYPKASVVGGPHFGGGSLVVERGSPIQPARTCSAGVGGVNPDLAEFGGVDAPEPLEAGKAVLQFGPVAFTFKPMMTSRTDWAEAAGSGDDEKTAKAKEKYDAAVEKFQKTVRAAEAGSDTPTGGSSLWQSFVEWVTSAVSGDEDKTKTTAATDNTGTEATTPDSSKGKPAPKFRYGFLRPAPAAHRRMRSEELARRRL